MVLDEILTHFGWEPAFKNSVGGYFDGALYKHGYEKPNNGTVLIDIKKK